jgi:ERCC4-type nuclease
MYPENTPGNVHSNATALEDFLDSITFDNMLRQCTKMKKYHKIPSLRLAHDSKDKLGQIG